METTTVTYRAPNLKITLTCGRIDSGRRFDLDDDVCTYRDLTFFQTDNLLRVLGVNTTDRATLTAGHSVRRDMDPEAITPDEARLMDDNGLAF
jgi:hypothetical protein